MRKVNSCPQMRRQLLTSYPTEEHSGVSEGYWEMRTTMQFKNQQDMVMPTVCNLASIHGFQKLKDVEFFQPQLLAVEVGILSPSSVMSVAALHWREGSFVEPCLEYSCIPSLLMVKNWNREQSRIGCCRPNQAAWRLWGAPAPVCLQWPCRNLKITCSHELAMQPCAWCH